MNGHRDPLCVEAMRTNRELRAELARLRAMPLRQRIAQLEAQLDAHRGSPWAYLPHYTMETVHRVAGR